MNIYLDMGTTNTRVYLSKDNQLLDTLYYKVGRKDLNDEKALITFLQTIKAQLKDDIDFISYSGMITSISGSYYLDHILLPISIKEYQNYVKESRCQVFKCPCFIYPGLKIISDTKVDMVRGEEIELIGLYDNKSGSYLLPGSHCKVIEIKDDIIIDINTTLSGELFHAITSDTILKECFTNIDDLKLINPTYIKQGYELSKQYPLAQALFKVRTLMILNNYTLIECTNIMLGLIYAQDVSLLNKDHHIIMAGHPIIIKVYQIILDLQQYHYEVKTNKLASAYLGHHQVKELKQCHLNK
ncbi:MAG: 2-dehydro-3-deoxygalactonokinase [Bacilli bacterium]